MPERLEVGPHDERLNDLKQTPARLLGDEEEGNGEGEHDAGGQRDFQRGEATTEAAALAAEAVHGDDSSLRGVVVLSLD